MNTVPDYSSEVLRHFACTEYVAPASHDLANWLTGRAGSRREGCQIDLYLQLAEYPAGDDKIARACHRAYGCPHALAAASWLCEWLGGRRTGAARALTARQLAAALELPAEKMYCALFAVDALRAALEQPGAVTVEASE